MKRTSLFSLCAAAAMCAAVLSGCGAASSAAPSTAPSAAAPSAAASSAAASVASVDLSGTAKTLLDANPISNQFAFTDNTMSLDIALPAEDYTGYYGVKSNDNGDAGTVAVIQAASGKADAVVSALEAYRDAQAAQLSNYPEFADAQSNMENAVIEAKGDLVVMAVASNECTDASALQAAVDSVLA
jgi:guanyl-specific ribonuclease Sa